MHEALELDCVQLTRRYRDRSLSPVEVTTAAIERLDSLNPQLNLTYVTNPEEALDTARASEVRWKSDEPRGPLDGIPTTIKDGLAWAGTPMYRGSAAHVEGGAIAEFDAPSVARLSEQGCPFLGKSTMPDFGILASGYSSHHGITRNPWDLSANSGGSSSGASAGVAANVFPCAIGTDIVGSIRLPASFCGIFGHKPSQGRVPYYPPNAPTLVAGPLTRTVTDAAVMLDVLSQSDHRDFTALPPPTHSFTSELDTPPAGRRLGLMTQLGFGPTPNREVLAAVEAAARLLEGEGYQIIPIDAPFARGDDIHGERFYKVRCFTEFSKFPSDVRARAEVIQNWTADVESIDATTLFSDMNVLLQQRERLMRLFDNIDFLLLPAVAIPAFDAELPAPDMSALFSPWSNTYLFNLTEQPAASINCGYTNAGLPIGLQIVGPRFDDTGVLRMARLYEQLRPEQRTPAICSP